MNFPTDIPASSPPSFVLDVSVGASRGVPTRYTLYAHRVQSRLAFGGATIIATNWPLDLTEELLSAESQGQTNRRRIDTLLASLATYRIYLDTESPHRAWPDVLDLARAHHIPVRDAAYLELALRKNLPLATIEPSLIGAANAAGVSIFTP